MLNIVKEFNQILNLNLRWDKKSKPLVQNTSTGFNDVKYHMHKYVYSVYKN